MSVAKFPTIKRLTVRDALSYASSDEMIEKIVIYAQRGDGTYTIWKTADTTCQELLWAGEMIREFALEEQRALERD